MGPYLARREVTELVLVRRREMRAARVAHDLVRVAVLAARARPADHLRAAVEAARVAEPERVAELVTEDEQRGRLVDPGLRAAAQPGPSATGERRKHVDELLVAREVVARLLRERPRLGGDLAVEAGPRAREARDQPRGHDTGELVLLVARLLVVVRDAVRVGEHAALDLRPRVGLGSRVRVLDQDDEDLRRSGDLGVGRDALVW